MCQSITLDSHVVDCIAVAVCLEIEIVHGRHLLAVVMSISIAIRTLSETSRREEKRSQCRDV